LKQGAKSAENETPKGSRRWEMGRVSTLGAL